MVLLTIDPSSDTAQPDVKGHGSQSVARIATARFLTRS